MTPHAPTGFPCRAGSSAWGDDRTAGGDRPAVVDELEPDMSFSPNKVLGAALAAVTVTFAINFVADIIFAKAPLAKAGFEVAVVAPAAAPAAGGAATAAAPTETAQAAPAAAPAAAAPAETPIADRLKTADAAAGEKSAKVCTACHSFDAAGTNKVGPGLYGVVGRQPGAHPGFKYSDGMTKFGATNAAWTYEMLDTYLTNPKTEVPGNKMAFAGLKKANERANVIAYLRTLADSPAPLP
jgi:cytochrome c